MVGEDDPTPAAEEAPSGEASPWWRKVLVFPLSRLLIALFLMAVAFIGRDVVASALLALPRDAEASRGVVTILCVYAAYVLHVRLIEGRPVRELHARQAPRELALGMAIGAGMITLVVGTLWALGAYRVEGVGSWGVLLVPLAATAATAFWEEVVFRGVVFRIVEEGTGTWVALLVSAVAFGLVHLGNEHVTLRAVATTALVAGVFLGGVYVLTRRLWLAIGAHYAVNVSQGPIFGLPVSGHDRTGLLRGRLEGPELLTGGPYGIDGSIVTAVLGAVVAGYVVWRAYERGRFVAPLWRSERRGIETGGVLPELR